MAKSDDTSRTRSSRNELEKQVAAETPAGASNPNSNFRPPARNAWEQAIEAERIQLMHARSVIVCLYEVLLHADGDEAVMYAEAAYVAAQLIDDSVERLDLVRLRRLLRKRNDGGGTPQGGGGTDADVLSANMVREEGVPYLC